MKPIYDKEQSDYLFDGDDKVVLNIRKCQFCKKRQLISQFYIDCKYRNICKFCYKEALLLHIGNL